MEISKILNQVSVKIPVRKTIGQPLAVFLNRLLRDRYDGNYLIPFVHNGKIYLRYPQAFATKQRIPAPIQMFEFNESDLDEFEGTKVDFRTPIKEEVVEKKEEPKVFRSNDALDLLRNQDKSNLSVPSDDNFGLPTSVTTTVLKGQEAINFINSGEAKPLDLQETFNNSSFLGGPIDIPSQKELETASISPKKEEKKQEGLRYNEGKLDYTLMDMRAFEPMIQVLEYGAHKYSVFKYANGNTVKGADISKQEVKDLKLEIVSSGRDNWKLGGPNMSLLKITSSLFRHLAALLGGEDNDKESGLSHIGHIQCNVMFLGYHMLQHIKKKKGKQGSKFDDRFKV